MNKKSQNSKIYFVTQEQKDNNVTPNNTDKKFNNDKVGNWEFKCVMRAWLDFCRKENKK